MITITYTTLKSAKLLKSGESLAIGTKIVSGAFLNQDGAEGLKLKQDAVDAAILAHAKLKRDGVKGDKLKEATKAIKSAETALIGRAFKTTELFLLVQGVLSVSLSPAEKGVLLASLKGLTPSDVA
jgi:hypothetical protein